MNFIQLQSVFATERVLVWPNHFCYNTKKKNLYETFIQKAYSIKKKSLSKAA